MKKKEGICMAQIYPQYLAEDRPYDPAYPISNNETLEYYTGDGCLWGQILVPAATYDRDGATGEYRVMPGTATLVVTGTI